MREAQMRAVMPLGVKPQTRGKLSGIPYNASFTNVAAKAGLNAPIVWGVKEHADFILESMGCGVAFLDYENDGWQDILLLTGQHLTIRPARPKARSSPRSRPAQSSASTRTIATARSPMSPPVPASAKPSGLPASPSPTTITTATKTSSSPAGARIFSSTTTETALSQTSPRKPDSPTTIGATPPAAPGSITIAMAISISSSRTTSSSIQQRSPRVAKMRTANTAASPCNAAPPASRKKPACSTATTALARSQTSSETAGISEARAALLPDRGRSRFRWRWLARYLRRLRCHIQPALPQQPRRRFTGTRAP